MFWRVFRLSASLFLFIAPVAILQVLLEAAQRFNLCHLHHVPLKMTRRT